jgi:hypothetical protein
MAITKRLERKRIEIINEGGFDFIYTEIKAIFEDELGNKITEKPAGRLRALTPVDDPQVHPDVTVDGEPVPVPQAIKDELQAIANNHFTSKMVSDYQAKINQAEPGDDQGTIDQT